MAELGLDPESVTLNTSQKTGDSGGTRDVSPLLTTSTHCLASENPILVHFGLNLTFDSGQAHLPSPAQPSPDLGRGQAGLLSLTHPFPRPRKGGG